MNDLAKIKEAARTAAFARRKVAHRNKHPGIAGHLSGVLARYRGVPLAGYMPIRTEIDPLSVMAEAAAHGPVGVPVIRGAERGLVFSRWHPGGEMVRGPFGAVVPQIEDLIVPEILIVPLVAFDLTGGRLGYGGGFYDRTLEMLRKARAILAIGFAYEAQVTQDLPLEPTDQPLDMIVTENRVIELPRRV